MLGVLVSKTEITPASDLQLRRYNNHYGSLVLTVSQFPRGCGAWVRQRRDATDTCTNVNDAT